MMPVDAEEEKERRKFPRRRQATNEKCVKHLLLFLFIDIPSPAKEGLSNGLPLLLKRVSMLCSVLNQRQQQQVAAHQLEVGTQNATKAFQKKVLFLGLLKERCRLPARLPE